MKLLYSRRDLNPYGHYWPLDFKSSVSTNSTTRAIRIRSLRSHYWYVLFDFKFINRLRVAECFFNPKVEKCIEAERKTGFEPATSTLARWRSTSWAIFANFCLRTFLDFSRVGKSKTFMDITNVNLFLFLIKYF